MRLLCNIGWISTENNPNIFIKKGAGWHLSLYDVGNGVNAVHIDVIRDDGVTLELGRISNFNPVHTNLRDMHRYFFHSNFTEPLTMAMMNYLETIWEEYSTYLGTD